MKKHIRTSLYIKDEDRDWYKALKQYAKSNKWSVSLAVRELLKAYFEVKSESISVESTANMPTKGKFAFGDKSNKPKKDPKKVDPDTFFAQVESQVMNKEENKDIDKQIEDCVKSRLDKNGNCSCYFFDNAREHFSFCKQHCWTNKKIWGKRVRL